MEQANRLCQVPHWSLTWLRWRHVQKGNTVLRVLTDGVSMERTTFTLHLHLADAFIQSDLHMCDLQCIHILHFTLMAHCTSGAIRGSVPCSRTLRQGIE